MTQQEMAEKLVIGIVHCSRIENGRAASIDVYISIAELFGVSLDYLLLGKVVNKDDMAAVKAEFNRYRDAMSKLFKL